LPYAVYGKKELIKEKRKITPMLPLCSLGNRRQPTIIKEIYFKREKRNRRKNVVMLRASPE
jgi:hypothetical protein